MAKNSTTYYPEEESITNYSSQFKAYYPSCSPADNVTPVSSSQSHRQAEKRRRDRINGQLARLRKLVPMSDKMDKAGLLERVVDQIKVMKRETTEISKFITIPTDTDEVTIECQTKIQQGITIPNYDKDNNKILVLIKATFCCEDRPDLISDLTRSLKTLKLTVIGADIACLGGRIKSILLLYYKDDGKGDNKEGDSGIKVVKESLMAVLSRLVSSSASTSNFRVTSKRQRFFFSSSS